MTNTMAVPSELSALFEDCAALRASSTPAAAWLRALADAWRDADAAIEAAQDSTSWASALARIWACRALHDAACEIECQLDPKADAALCATDSGWARGRLDAMELFSEGAPDDARVSSGWMSLLDAAEGAWLDEVVARWRRCSVPRGGSIDGAVVEAFVRERRIERALDELGRVTWFGDHDRALRSLLPHLTPPERAFAVERAFALYTQAPGSVLQYVVEALRGLIALGSPEQRDARLRALREMVDSLETTTDMTGDCPAHRDLRAEVALAHAEAGDVPTALAWLRRLEAIPGTESSQRDVIAALPLALRDELGPGLLSRVLRPDHREDLYDLGREYCELSPATARECLRRLDPDDRTVEAVALRLAAAAEVPETAEEALTTLAASMQNEATRSSCVESCATLAPALARLGALDTPACEALVEAAFQANDPHAIGALLAVRPAFGRRAFGGARTALTEDVDDDVRWDWVGLLGSIARSEEHSLAEDARALRDRYEDPSERIERGLREGDASERARVAHSVVRAQRARPLRSTALLTRRSAVPTPRDEAALAFGALASEALEAVERAPNLAEGWATLTPWIAGASVTVLVRIERGATSAVVEDSVWCAIALRAAALGDDERSFRCLERIGRDYLRDDTSVRAAIARGSAAQVEASLAGVLASSRYVSVQATAVEQVGAAGFVRCVDALCPGVEAASIERRARARIASADHALPPDAHSEQTDRLARDALALRDERSVEASVALGFAAAALDGPPARAMLAELLSFRRRNLPWWPAGLWRSPLTVATATVDPAHRAAFVAEIEALVLALEGR